MSITRVFRVEVHGELKSEFEPKFNSVSRDMVEKAAGCIRQRVLKPTRWTPNEYAMISEWETEADLMAFVGEDWNQSVIPPDMARYAKSHCVSHFQSWE